jgi:hypothetical protein
MSWSVYLPRQLKRQRKALKFTWRTEKFSLGNIQNFRQSFFLGWLCFSSYGNPRPIRWFTLHCNWQLLLQLTAPNIHNHSPNLTSHAEGLISLVSSSHRI